MVPLTAADWLHQRRQVLRDVVATSVRDAPPHAQAFARRILPPEAALLVSPRAVQVSPQTADAQYGGGPEAAALGFSLGGVGQQAPAAAVRAFRNAVSRLQRRSGDGIVPIASDEVAVLGIADGIAGLGLSDRNADAAVAGWLIAAVERHVARTSWARRMQALALELVDERGRLRTRAAYDDPEITALDVALRRTWPGPFVGTLPPDQEAREALTKSLLTGPCPGVGDLERAAVWLTALEVLVDQGVSALVPKVDDVVRILERTQSALRRWVWEERSARSPAAPARWLIDNEAHVQAFLWAALSPVFGSALRGEEYLQGFGLLQPRFDLAVADLRVIIEVKIVRAPRDFPRVEEEIAGDLGVYFADPRRFDHMIVYVYDDCDAPVPERYDQLRTALLERDPKVRGVVVVTRPSMIPGRKQRGRQGIVSD